MKLATREIIREIDRISIEEHGIHGLILMENAGRAAANVLLEEFPWVERVAIFAGGGNNGGDGFVIARHLISYGLDVTTYLVSDPGKYKGDALTNFEALRNIGGELVELREDGLLEYKESDVIVDALFGTGVDREVKGFYRNVIEFINSQPVPCVAVDVPSGLDINTGFPLGVAVKADITVTFALPKVGLAIYPGIDYAGKVYVADITTPKFLEKDIPFEIITYETVREILKPRHPDTHKGTYGHLFALSGSPGKTGAATLIGLGALRVGTGLVTVGVPKSLNPIMEQKLTEAMTEPVTETEAGVFGKGSVETALNLMSSRKTALAIGPGITTTEDTAEFLYEILKNSSVPIVADADAVTLIAQNLNILKEARVPIVLTPHPGEMSRLIGKSSKEVQEDRIGVARDFSSKYNVYVLLKGARSLVATPDGRVFINPTGNPGMASGGMGDVLTGIVGGFLAQGYSPDDACVLSVFSHGLAGDLVARRKGEAGIIAGDIADAMPEAIREILYGEGEEFFYRIR
ncbi:MAG TPA: NAD(P)H-hydrate dehydratase [Thermodesulfobacteriota bacterium]|nr:NAD(P)H-hydrate dehydratase [Thermodesulfobacteriota bacterium]